MSGLTPPQTQSGSTALLGEGVPPCGHSGSLGAAHCAGAAPVLPPRPRGGLGLRAASVPGLLPAKARPCTPAVSPHHPPPPLSPPPPSVLVPTETDPRPGSTWRAPRLAGWEPSVGGGGPAPRSPRSLGVCSRPTCRRCVCIGQGGLCRAPRALRGPLGPVPGSLPLLQPGALTCEVGMWQTQLPVKG